MKIYKRETYLNKIRGFYDDDETIKVIVGIRRCGKSYLLKSIIEELKSKGVKEKDIIYIRLDKRPYKSIKTPEELENVIESLITDDDFKYVFIDEVQNVKGYEEVIDSYRGEGNMSIFITGSNSYLLSGELATKLTGRKIEIEMMPLNFFEYVDMKRFYKKEINSNIYIEFQEYIRDGGFPGSIKYDNHDDKVRYTQNIINDIFKKDIKPNEKIRNPELFATIQTFIVNNFGSMISVSSIRDYYKGKNINIDERTIDRYIKILENAKILYKCDTFDIKSKEVLKGERKYYLADLSIYYALNTDARINYGPVLENVLHNYLLSKDYSLSVGKIGKFECDFIARKGIEDYFYIQVSKNIDDEKTEEREYRPFYKIEDMYPRFLFVLDMVLQKNVNGVRNVNIVDFIYNNLELISDQQI
ncbi:MAG: ATP-binding protein [Clostridia bacterium]|nr:ATP-binding protein [Clostridia bacterium]